MSVYVDANNIRIEDSYTINHKQFKNVLNKLKTSFTSNVFTRSMWSLCCEWAVHNVLYRLGIWRSHTKDVDLNYPNKWAWAYVIVGTIVYPFA